MGDPFIKIIDLDTKKNVHQISEIPGLEFDNVDNYNIGITEVKKVKLSNGCECLLTADYCGKIFLWSLE